MIQNNIQFDTMLYNNIITAMLIALNKNILYKKRMYLNEIISLLGDNIFMFIDNLPANIDNKNIPTQIYSSIDKLNTDNLTLDIKDNVLNIYLTKSQNNIGLFFQINLYTLIDQTVLANLYAKIVGRKNYKTDVDYIYNLFKTDNTLKREIELWILNAKNNILNNVYSFYSKINEDSIISVMSLVNGYSIFLFKKDKILKSDTFNKVKIFLPVVISLIVSEYLDRNSVILNGFSLDKIPISHNSSFVKTAFELFKDKPDTKILLPIEITYLDNDNNDNNNDKTRIFNKVLNISYSDIYNKFNTFENTNLNIHELILYLNLIFNENIGNINEKLIMSDIGLTINSLYSLMYYLIYVPIRSHWIYQWKIKSFTNNKDIYTIMSQTNDIVCDCPDFTYRGKKKGMCKHIKALYDTFSIVKRLFRS